MSNAEIYELISHYSKQIETLKKLVGQSTPKLKFYSYKQASEMLGITVDGLKSRIKRGQMIRICNNNRPLIAHAEIMRFLGGQNPDGGFGAFLNVLIKLLYPMQKHFGASC